jgi:hypothetical protein
MAVLDSYFNDESASPHLARQNRCEVTNSRTAESQSAATGISFLASTLATAGSSVSDGAPVTSGRTVGRSAPSGVSGIRQPTRLSDSSVGWASPTNHSSYWWAMPTLRNHYKVGTAHPFPTAEEAVRHKAVITLALLGTIACSSGCARTVLIPKIGFDHIAVRPHFAEPVFAGPGSIGPIFSMPRIVTPCKSCDPCGNPCDPCNSCGPCGAGGSPLQPIDPFGWLRVGSLGTQEIDPVGWVFGL